MACIANRRKRVSWSKVALRAAAIDIFFKSKVAAAFVKAALAFSSNRAFLNANSFAFSAANDAAACFLANAANALARAAASASNFAKRFARSSLESSEADGA